MMFVHCVIAIILHAMFTAEPIRGQSLPSLPELLTSDGFPIPPLQSNSSSPTNNIFQLVFLSLRFEACLNITGWLFKAETTNNQEELILGMDDKALIFTLWDYSDEHQFSDVEVFTTFTRRELNSTRATSVQKIAGISPSLYYYELEEAIVTQDGSVIGIRGTNKALGIHFTNINGSSGPVPVGWRIERDSATFTCSNLPRSFFLKQGTSFPYLPLVTPIFGDSLENITNQIYSLLNISITTTTIPIDSSTTKWIIIGAVVGSVLALGAMFTITAIATVLLTHWRTRKENRKVKKWQQSNTNNGEMAQEMVETNGHLSAPYLLVNSTATVDGNLWQGVSAKERDTQGIELTMNKECSETADCASIQLTQNVAYQRWRGKHDNVRATASDHNSGYVILDSAVRDNQTGYCSVQYSSSMPDDYDYI